MNTGEKRVLFALLFFVGFFVLVYASCGNGTCDPGENSCNCEADCGTCGGNVPNETCKYYACETSQCTIKTLENCCGNDLCEASEDFGTCPGDCLPENLDFEIISPSEGESFFRGQSVFISMKISGDGRNILSANALVRTPFGNINVFNDGKHDDGPYSDAVYANYITVKNSADEGENAVKVEGEFRGVETDYEFTINIEPQHEIDMDINERYVLGSNILLVGRVKNGDHTFAMPLNITIFDGRNTVYDSNVESNEAGKFSVEYRSSLIDRKGTWTVSISGVDGNFNTVDFNKSIELIEPGTEEFLKIELLTPFDREFERGEEISVIVSVKNSSGGDVNNATVTLTGPQGETVIDLIQLTPGQYSNTYLISFTAKGNEHAISIRAEKDDGLGTMSGSRTAVIRVKNIEVNVEIVEPSGRYYEVGDNLSPTVFISYPNGVWVVDANATVFINQKQVNLKAVRTGTFTASYTVKEEDIGMVKVWVQVEDAAGNKGKAEKYIEITGFSLSYIIEKNIELLYVVGLLLVSIAAVVIAIRTGVIRITTKQSLEKKIAKLKNLEKGVQNKYFKEAAIPKEEYEASMEKYEADLEAAKKELERMKNCEKKK